MNRIGAALIAGLLAMVVMPAAASAQAGSTAQISGTVTDSSGGVLPGVDVTVTQTDTGLMRSAVTDATGGYTLPNLPVGPYRLEAVAVRLPHLRADGHRADGQRHAGRERRDGAR